MKQRPQDHLFFLLEALDVHLLFSQVRIPRSLTCALHAAMCATSPLPLPPGTDARRLDVLPSVGFQVGGQEADSDKTPSLSQARRESPRLQRRGAGSTCCSLLPDPDPDLCCPRRPLLPRTQHDPSTRCRDWRCRERVLGSGASGAGFQRWSSSGPPWTWIPQRHADIAGLIVSCLISPSLMSCPVRLTARTRLVSLCRLSADSARTLLTDSGGRAQPLRS